VDDRRRTGCVPESPDLVSGFRKNPEQFIRKWTAANLSERSAAQQHFLDLCTLLHEPTPAEVDPDGDTFTFEKGGATATGGRGWADVWKKGAFAVEYKGPGKDLQAAYYQLKKYADALENPPLLITCDTKRLEIHTNFTNTVKTVHVLELGDLADPAKRELLKNAFSHPERFRPGTTRLMVTKDAAERFSELAHHLQARGYEPHRVAHFLNRVIFCMFAEDVELLPSRIFTKLVTASIAHPETFETHARQLFAGMATGGSVAFEVIDWFNGGLFDDDSTLPLTVDELKLVLRCADLDWSNIEPSIFGTLFERGLDPDKRSQQGAHYTDPETIMKIVNPVVLEPWQREWEAEKAEFAKLLERAKRTVSEAAQQRYFAFLERLHQFRVLDPACGSGNFLYLALRTLKDFEKRVILEAEALGLPPQFPRVGPEAVKGIEINPYAAELARVTIWIGELQWMIENGFGAAKNPILKPLDQIECRDAILNDNGTEPEWPRTDVIVGNPPFLGDKRMRAALGDAYVKALRELYDGRVPGGADLVTYWFEKARAQIDSRMTRHAGLVATNSIRGGASRKVLDRINQTGAIFCAWSDEPWVNEGAAVRVSLIAFGSAQVEIPKRLDGTDVGAVYTDLTARSDSSSAGLMDLTQAKPLATNAGIAFQGPVLVGPFEVTASLARSWLSAPNPHRRENREVLRPLTNGRDITGRTRGLWVVDFGTLPESSASLFERPFEYVREHVKPVREKNRDQSRRNRWWLHGRLGTEWRRASASMSRYIATSQVSKHRTFVWQPSIVWPHQTVIAIARSDDTTFGIVHSHLHAIWSLRLGTSLEDRPRYTPTTTFETFPFPEGLTPDVSAAEYADDRSAPARASARSAPSCRPRSRVVSRSCDFDDSVLASRLSSCIRKSRRRPAASVPETITRRVSSMWPVRRSSSSATSRRCSSSTISCSRRSWSTVVPSSATRSTRRWRTRAWISGRRSRTCMTICSSAEQRVSISSCSRAPSRARVRRPGPAASPANSPSPAACRLSVSAWSSRTMPGHRNMSITSTVGLPGAATRSRAPGPAAWRARGRRPRARRRPPARRAGAACSRPCRAAGRATAPGAARFRVPRSPPGRRNPASR
jgi:hypothetical protein